MLLLGTWADFPAYQQEMMSRLAAVTRSSMAVPCFKAKVPRAHFYDSLGSLGLAQDAAKARTHSILPSLSAAVDPISKSPYTSQYQGWATLPCQYFTWHFVSSTPTIETVLRQCQTSVKCLPQ